MNVIREKVFLSRILNRIIKYFLKIRETTLLKVLENAIKYYTTKNAWNSKLFYCWKVVWDPKSLFWVLKSEKDFHLKLNLMGSFWRFFFVMHGKHPVFGMFRSETFFYCVKAFQIVKIWKVLNDFASVSTLALPV